MSNVTTQYENDAFTTVALDIDLGHTDIQVSDGSVFPSTVPYYVTIENLAGDIEVLHVTARSANTLTVTRGVDNTAPRQWVVGDYVESRLNAAVLEELRDHNHDIDYAPLAHEHDAVYVNISGDEMLGNLKGPEPLVEADYATKNYVDLAIPIGSIIAFNTVASVLPSNYQLCDGTNDTPDLVDRFILGTITDGEMGDVGGSANAVVVSHNHTANHDHANATTSSNGSHTHSLKGGQVGDLPDPESTFINHINVNTDFIDEVNTSAPVASGGAHTHTLNLPNQNVNTSTVGSSATDANLPPFYKLAYIQRMS